LLYGLLMLHFHYHSSQKNISKAIHAKRSISKPAT